MDGRVADAVLKATAFLKAVQLPDGSFESYSSPSAMPFRPKLTYHTTFTPALILSAISRLEDTDARAVRKSLATWLLAQRSPHWSFNYWAVAAPERQHLSYPDDLDDTFCALLALHNHDPNLVDEAVLANAVKLLIATESAVGGPYRTWLAAADTPAIWHDVDLAVNANVAAFLGRVAEPLPNVTAFMEQAIAGQTFTSPYYPSPYPIVYYLARAYDGLLVPELVEYLISQRRDGWWGSPLQTALAIMSLIRLGRKGAHGTAVKRLLASQQPDGSWPAEAFCIDPAVKNKTYYSGSAALTTAFIIEALASMRHPGKRAAVKTRRSDDFSGTLLGQVAALLRQDTARLGPALRRQTRAALKAMQAQDANREIRLLPHFFNQSLATPVPYAPLARLGAASLYGWTAYTIYDDFLDGEGDPLALSAANAAMRLSLQHFRQALPDDTAFQAHAELVFNIVDDANAWELAHCRMAVTNRVITVTKLPRYAATLDLANRSLGHTLTPLGVLAAMGVPPNDPRARHIGLAFRHYITARQLNDDLHDWQPDLRAGIITYVVTNTLNMLSIKPGRYAFARLLPTMQKTFWHGTLPAVCQVIARHTAASRAAAKKSGLLLPDNIISKLTRKIDQSVERTLSEQTKAENFLAAYQNDTISTIHATVSFNAPQL